ncbi:MAG: AmmeMemoRadiSam system protein B [Bacteroidales bacterium]|nr:AmmeMemoRadiSam system protein B [Bacteroidales bacterium]MBN2819752.1 AmmeMemoRadiSam system protein B [Bacteroidales bacterium]
MDLFSKYIDREAIAAGRFYSAHAEKLEIEIKNMLEEARVKIEEPLPENKDILALIAPHAGYVFSGVVSASAFLQLENLEKRKKIFLIGSSHHTDFNGASVYNTGNYLTPFGKVGVDIEIANALIEKSPVFEFVRAAHAHEHSLEVMLPFIQYFWKDNFEIVPIIISTHRQDTCKQIADVLLPYFKPENLFVISTDLSHYPNYNDAVKVDKTTVEAVLSGVPEALIEQIEINKKLFIPNLATSMCGWTSVLTLMYMMDSKQNSFFYPILYQNSGDAETFSDKSRVVGYQSMAVYAKQSENKFELKEKDKEKLLNLARKSIEYYLNKIKRHVPDTKNYSKSLQTACGAFVSVYVNDELRGCIGRIISKSTPLVEVVADVSVSAACFDNRFTSINRSELDKMKIEISVLTPLRRIKTLDELELGKHGIYIKKGVYSGTFLPQVADKHNMTKEEFVGKCSKDKAGIGWDGWKEAELYTYEAIVFKEE